MGLRRLLWKGAQDLKDPSHLDAETLGAAREIKNQSTVINNPDAHTIQFSLISFVRRLQQNGLGEDERERHYLEASAWD